MHNPYAALSRDEEDRGGVQEDVRKGAESDPADILEKMVDRHRKAEEHMKQQLEDLSKSHNQVRDLLHKSPAVRLFLPQGNSLSSAVSVY